MPHQHEKTGTGSCEPNCISGHQAVWTIEHPGYGTTSNSSVCQNTVVLESWLKDFNSSSKGVSPTLSEISQKLFQVTSNDVRGAPWPGFSAYQAEEPSSKLPCNTALCSYRPEEVALNAVEEKKEPAKLRLFGVDLINHIKSTANTDKISVGAEETLIRAACSYEDSGQLSAFSKVTKDHTQFVNESHREIQSHQSSAARTRIKVQVSFYSLFCFLNCTLI
jgi:auxin response factor